MERIGEALRQARKGILIIAGTCAVSLVSGATMANTGNRFALDYRDSLAAIPETVGGLRWSFRRVLPGHTGVAGCRFHPGRWRGPASGLRVLSAPRPVPRSALVWIAAPALIDVAWLYALVVPLFSLGSAWEFFGPGG